MRYSGSWKTVIRICIECGKGFTSKTHGGTKQFCSYSCSNKHKWESRKRKPKNVIKRVCINCKKEFEKITKLSLSQWSRNKYCSVKCAGEYKRIKDGMTKGERYNRKRGRLKMFTPEWLDRIKSTTKDAMQKPEIRLKMTQLRKPMTDEGKIIRSDALMGKMPKNTMFGHNSFPNVQKGDYETSKGTIFFRSKWEANYALYLDFLIKKEQIKDWEFEVDRFIFDAIKFGTRSYLPDFKIYNMDGTFEYHEVKGYMDNRSKTKLKRMEKYFPNTKLILIDKDVYNNIKKNLGKSLHFY